MYNPTTVDRALIFHRAATRLSLSLCFKTFIAKSLPLLPSLLNVVVKKISSVEQIAGCHILFICASEKDNLSQILKTVHKQSMLTIGDTKGFANSGVMINLVLIEDKIGFEINPAEADNASLKISSKLLKLGKIVK